MGTWTGNIAQYKPKIVTDENRNQGESKYFSSPHTPRFEGEKKQQTNQQESTKLTSVSSLAVIINVLLLLGRDSGNQSTLIGRDTLPSLGEIILMLSKRSSPKHPKPPTREISYLSLILYGRRITEFEWIKSASPLSLSNHIYSEL